MTHNTEAVIERDDRNYHGKYNMDCKYIRPQPYNNGMMCIAFTYGTCICETCSQGCDNL